MKWNSLYNEVEKNCKLSNNFHSSYKVFNDYEDEEKQGRAFEKQFS